MLDVSRCQLLLCSRQTVAVLRAAVCLYACALDSVTLTRLDVTRVTCSCRSCYAGSVWKLTCKNQYSHVAVLALLARCEWPASMRVRLHAAAGASIVLLACCPGRDMTGRTGSWFVRYSHSVSVCVLLLRITHSFGLWYHRFVVQLRLIGVCVDVILWSYPGGT